MKGTKKALHIRLTKLSKSGLKADFTFLTVKRPASEALRWE
jgi:hypothetical protein